MQRQYLFLCLVFLWLVSLGLGASGCTTQTLIPEPDAGPPFDAGMDAGTLERDAGPLDPDAACVSETAGATVETLPVDIIWLVDNSGSMQEEIDQVRDGLNDFAASIGDRQLDYRVILLSLRGRGVANSRYRICVPPPLAGDADCGDGERFFQVDVDMISSQLIEQVLGTLSQTQGYREGETRGSAPWYDLLRPEATKTFVVVTDDNARTCLIPHIGATMPYCDAGEPELTATSLEDFPGGPNPFNDEELGQGILAEDFGGLFDDYVFSGIYGWGSETDPTDICSYNDPDITDPDSPGQTYTTLVERTGGVRAQICDGAAAWAPFFDAVSGAVADNSRIECEVAIPEPPEGMFFQPNRINVWVDSGFGEIRVGNTVDATGCGPLGGWYYDDLDTPTQVILCPATCIPLQAAPADTRSVEVQFGCSTIPI